MRHEGGFRKLYSGFTPTLLGILPYAGTSFMIYGGLKKKLRDTFPDILVGDPPREGERDKREVGIIEE